METPKTLDSSRVEQDGARKKARAGRIPGEIGLGIGGAQLGQLHAMEGSRVVVVDPQDG